MSGEQLRDAFKVAWSRWEARRLRGLDTESYADATREAAANMFDADALDPRAEIAIRVLTVARASFAAAWPYMCDAWEVHSSDVAREAGHAIEVEFAKLERALKAGR